MAKKPAKPAPLDRPCNFCRIVHGYKETCAQARARVARKGAKPRKAKP